MEAFEGNHKEWDKLLIQCEDYTFYQSYAWGEAKKSQGWRVKRFIEKANKQFAIAQAFEKQIPLLNFKFLWIPGGPALTDVNDLKLIERIITDIEKRYENSGYIIRYNQQILRKPNLINLWRKLGYVDPVFPITLNLNIILDLMEVKSLESQSHPKFRYSIRKAKKNSDLKLLVGGDDILDDTLDIYFQMVSIKGIRSYREKDFLKRMFYEMKENIQIIMVKLEKTPISCVMLICIGDKAFYFLGASNEIGRRYLASYLIFDYIPKWCRDNGIRHFDLCGIDPLTNYETYRFKRRTGGKIVEYIGEKEKASSPYVKLLFNLGLRFRGFGI